MVVVVNLFCLDITCLIPVIASVVVLRRLQSELSPVLPGCCALEEQVLVVVVVVVVVYPA